MKNRIIGAKEITYKELQEVDKVREVVALLEKKVPLKKAVKQIYNK